MTRVTPAFTWRVLWLWIAVFEYGCTTITLSNSCNVPPGTVGEAGRWAMVRAGSRATCGVDLSQKPNRLRCWGYDSDGLSYSKIFPQEGYPLTEGPPLSLDVGIEHVCILDSKGSPICWGYQGQIEVAPGPWTALDLDGVASPGIGLCALDLDSKPHCFGDGLWKPVLQVPDVALRSISLERSYACGISEEGKLYCWGYPMYNLDAEFVAVPEPYGERIDVGDSITCVRTPDARGVCWGELKDNPWNVGADVAEIVGSAFAVCVIFADGRLKCDQMGRWKGHASPVVDNAPSIRGLHGLSCGDHHCCATMKSGLPICWGARGALQTIFPQ